MEDKATLESDLSAIWGFAGEWCLAGTAPFLHLMRVVWYPQSITPLVKPSVKLLGCGGWPPILALLFIRNV